MTENFQGADEVACGRARERGRERGNFFAQEGKPGFMFAERIHGLLARWSLARSLARRLRTSVYNKVSGVGE